MATSDWTGAVNGNLGTAGNWSPATVPNTNGDTARVGTDIASAVAIDAGLTTFNAVTGMKWKVGPLMTKAIGTSGAAIQLSTGATLDYNGLNCPLASFDIETCDKARIFDPDLGKAGE